MTLSVYDLLLYAGALFVLFLTPGPVWVGLLARTMSGGFAGAWPLALGVVVGDVVWSLLAILGMAWVVDQYEGAMLALRWIAMVILIVMGVLIIRSADKEIAADSSLTRPGVWAGFLAGLAVILSNPKAILFYMGLMPGFFDLGGLTRVDIAVIAGLSAAIPLVGNLILAALVVRVRALLKTPSAVRRMNLSAGALLICVGLVVPFV